MESVEHSLLSLTRPGRGELTGAGWGALLAAWSLDEAGERESARLCRERALELWERAEEAGEPLAEQGPVAAHLLLAEVARRAGRFEAARSRCHRGLSGRPQEPFRSLLEFELELITARDTSVHSASEAIGPWG